MFANPNHTYSMHTTNNNRNKQHVSPSKTKTQQQQQLQPSSTLLQRLNPFSKETTTDGKTKNCRENKPADVKLQPSPKNVSSDEYQGVKNLKQYWDKKISHTKLLELDKRPRPVKSATLDNKPSKLFISEINRSSNPLNRQTCCKTVPLERNNKKEVPDNSRKFKHEPSALPILRLDLKNSYKYKSSDSVSKRLSGELSPLTENHHVIKRFRPESVNLPINRHSVSTLNFPAISTTNSGGKIHWAKREEIFGKRAIKKETHTDKAELIAPHTNYNRKMSIKDNENQVNQTEMAQNILSQDDKKLLSTANDKCNKTDKSINITTNSLVSPDNSSFVATSNKLLCSTLSVSSVTSATESPSRKTARKFSFKTNSNAATPYHKKMSANGGSKVAALTQRFNHLIQLDASLLEEVKRRGIVVHKTGGNVYKIKEGVEFTARRRSTKRSDESTDDASSIGKPVKKKTSVRRKVSARVSHQRNNNSSIGSVKATIQLFEPKATNISQAKVKPKVPDKSEQVLEKTKELKIKKNSTKPENPKPNKCVKSDLENNIGSFKSVKTSSPITSVLEKLDEIPEVSETTESPKEKCVEKLKISDEATKQSKEKSKYSKIYDKIRFRPSFFQSKKLDKIEVTSQIETSKSVQNFEEIILTPHPVDTIYDRFDEELHSVHDRIDSLSKSVCNLTTSKEQYDDVARNVKPNESFLFRTTSKSNFYSTYDFLYKTSVVEAVNSSLINKTQSMDEGSFPHSQNFTKQISMNDSRTYIQMLQEADELIKKFSKKDDELNTTDDGYELYSESPPGVAAEAINEELVKNMKVEKASEAPVPIISECDLTLLQTEEGIYQSLQEVTKTTVFNDAISIDSYESLERYEEVPDEGSAESFERENNLKIDEDQYEVCDPPEPPPRILETPSSLSSDQPPKLPSPKRLVTIKTVNSCTNYEKIHYEQMPSRPPKSSQSTEKQYVPLPPRNSFSENNLRVSFVTVNQEPRVISDEQEPDYYDENIYDTIKNGDNKSISSNCYESFNKVHKSHGDTISLISNCYESISLKNEYRPTHMLRHADSISTLSSDHKTNSLYGTTIGLVTTPPSERGSDASDDWIDVSDDESEPKKSFIVVRERTKPHKSPEWSRKIRDHLVNQQQTEGFDDDSDHHYESLYSIEQARSKRGTQASQSTIESPIITANFSKLTSNEHDDDYDSFSEDETDEDRIEEKKKNDSGVDISRKLPDPPQTKTQVYALMQKMKNFGSLTKNEITKGLSKIASTKKKSTVTSPSSKLSSPGGQQYENTVVGPNKIDYQNTSFDGEKKKSLTRSAASKPGIYDPYENTEFHSPRLPTTPPSPAIYASDVLLSPLSPQIRTDGTVPADTPPEKVTRKKSKSGKSFKSKFRKSITPDTSLSLGSSFNGTRSTFYVSDSMDVDSGIFTGNDKQASTEDMNMASSSPATPTNSNLNSSVDLTNVLVPPERRRSRLTPDLTKRKSSLGIRPNNPPPPPPPVSQMDKKLLKSKRLGTTSWYAECGVFKSETLKNEGFCADGKRDRSASNTNSCWYSEAGLYQTSGVSVASSSGSSGVSTGGECGPGDDNSHSMFLNEPLYQIYSAAKLESITQDIDHSDGYEEVGGRLNDEMGEEEKRNHRPSALQLIEPNNGPSRTLWCEIPEVINSQILLTLTLNEKRLQEAKFEILTSEASYLKSVNLLKCHFMNHPAFRDHQILSSADRKTLFSYIIPVQECSDRLLCDLENHWQDSIMLMGLHESIYKHAEKHFHVYVTYCEHQGKLDRTLKRLRDGKCAFSQALETLELDPVCCSLSLYSFLMLPMQRITRLPLLIDAVLSKLKADDDEYQGWKMTLAILNKIVSQCNEAAKRCQQTMELETISRQIEFPSHIRPLAIMPVGVSTPGVALRRLIKCGELTQMVWRGEDAKLTFGKKFAKSSIYGFLFTDLLVLTKKKSDSSFLVFDHCPRSLLTVSSGDVIPQLPTKDMASIGKHLMIMTLLENCDGKTVEMILSCPSETDRQRWLQATEPRQSDNPDEKLYEQWDCPQVIAKHTYQALQPDELSLDPGDVVNVLRKMADGWYHGERLRDGVEGWFPGNYTEEVASPHVRARNLKQRYRLLTFTANYLESQKQK